MPNYCVRALKNILNYSIIRVEKRKAALSQGWQGLWEWWIDDCLMTDLLITSSNKRAGL